MMFSAFPFWPSAALILFILSGEDLTADAFIALPTSTKLKSSRASSDRARWAANPARTEGTVVPSKSIKSKASETSSSVPMRSTSSDDQRGALADPPAEPNSKLRQLKDRMWVREALEDLTAAEFASSLSVEAEEAEDKKKKQKRAVDFENLLTKLDRRLDEMCITSTTAEAAKQSRMCYVLDQPLNGDGEDDKKDQTCYILKSGEGMGSVVYSDEQREALFDRIIASRDRLVKSMGGVPADDDDVSAGDLDEIREKLQDEIAEAEESAVAEEKSDAKSLKIGDANLYVRDDGTIDWDGALQDRAALKTFGTAVWARINGQDPETVDEDSIKDVGTAVEGEKKAVTAKIIETDAIREKKGKLDMLKQELQRMEANHTALLNSAIRAGQAVANVNLATLDPVLRSKIRASDEELDKKRQEVSFQTVNYELERIYTYLEGEMGNTATKGYIPLQDRLNVAEFGLLESQLASLNLQLEGGDIIDEDVLAVVLDQVTDFKRRLGIDYYVTGLTYDKEAIQMWLNDLLLKTKNGLAFYVKGCQLFWDDIVFCLSLISRALQGYTLKPREVRTLRRTFKDVITFIPVVIILIIPLSPVGHVLVFGAIQRVFPEFFPSCFTERRQNLLELYESTEYTAVTIDETWQEKIARIVGAAAFFVASSLRQLYVMLGGKDSAASESSEESLNKS